MKAWARIKNIYDGSLVSKIEFEKTKLRLFIYDYWKKKGINLTSQEDCAVVEFYDQYPSVMPWVKDEIKDAL